MSDSQHDNESIEISFDPSIEFYLRAVAEWGMDHERTRLFAQRMRSQSIWALSFAIFIIVSAECWVLWSLTELQFTEKVLALAIGCALITLVIIKGVPLLSLDMNKRKIAKQNALDALASVAACEFSRTTLRFDSDGFENRDALRTTRTSWAVVAGSKRTRSALFIITADDRGPVIPLEEIENTDLKRIEHMIAAHAAGPDTQDQIIARVLATRDLLCPGCKYQCRGVMTARCPECGRAIVKEDFIMTDAAAQIVIREHLGI